MSPTLPKSLAKAHSWARMQPWLGRFTLMNRLLLGMAFIPTGMVKLLGQRFTALPVDNPVGFFFEAMYQTGVFWNFIGFMQVFAAVCLLIPATSTLGAVIFVPLIFSIVLVTWGIGFGGTVYVTALMLLSAIYLVCWDADKVWSAGSRLFVRSKAPDLLEGASIIEKTGWALGGVVGILLFLTTRGLFPNSLVLELFIAGVLAFLVVLGSWITLAVRGSQSTPPPEQPDNVSSDAS